MQTSPSLHAFVDATIDDLNCTGRNLPVFSFDCKIVPLVHSIGETAVSGVAEQS